ncbi:site-specific integrase [Paraburkholderia sp. C35]|uniref:site-specific integrase n=1 Tax=Paraburkholderia sp. C35 TaxID=2126993 RepID=UPI001EF43BCF|nr:site-specific integrase [Paraburkholderia sp. C35]
MEEPHSSGLFPDPSSAGDIIERLLRALPALPPVVRYYDDFDDKQYSIRDPSNTMVFELAINGRTIRVDFTPYELRHALLLKHLFVYLLGQDLTVSTAANYLISATHLPQRDIADIVCAGPVQIASVWAALRVREMPVSAYILAKSLLRLLCRYRIQGWSDSYSFYVTNSLPLPARDAYAGVHSGDVFLSLDEEAAIVRHLDESVAALRSSASVPYEALCDTGMLLCAYQFAMRPIQIAMLSMRNVRIWHEAPNGLPTVHLTFHMAKQRSEAKRRPLTRRVKREWAPVFVALDKWRRLDGASGNAHFFNVQSNYEAGARIAALVRKLIGSDDLGTSTDLRHTAAQRLVDAGASHEELAEFMGHSYVQTGLVYFRTSASHAERVNRALGASDVYRRVARIAHDRFISPEELTQLKGDQQIAGVPHGIPIAGIGGCTSGQPACPYNPVTSCYGCRKFMPLRDKAMHESVLASMREVVVFFEQGARGDTRSPTYLQLQRTITEIQTVIDELESEVR